jgi:hypothetical protein
VWRVLDWPKLSSTNDEEKLMPGPFIFIATNKLKPGVLERERERAGELAQFIAEAEPRLLAFNEYADEGGSEVGVVQVHPDAESMLFHMEAVRERAAQAYAETLEGTTAIQVFGPPHEAILGMLRQQAGAGVDLSIKPFHLGGFTRLQSA